MRVSFHGSLKIVIIFDTDALALSIGVPEDGLSCAPAGSNVTAKAAHGGVEEHERLLAFDFERNGGHWWRLSFESGGGL